MASRRATWQFTLRTLLIVVAVLSVVFGCAAWRGVPGAIGAIAVANLCALGFAVWSRRKPLAIGWACCLTVPGALAALYHFGPHSVVILLCPTCGKERGVETYLGVTWRDAERETPRSEWYEGALLKAHAHRWVHLCSTHQHWGGQVDCWDSFGFELHPLDLLRDASGRLDAATFEDLAEEYDAMGEDLTRMKNFIVRCRKIVPDEHLQVP